MPAAFFLNISLNLPDFRVFPRSFQSARLTRFSPEDLLLSTSTWIFVLLHTQLAFRPAWHLSHQPELWPHQKLAPLLG